MHPVPHHLQSGLTQLLNLCVHSGSIPSPANNLIFAEQSDSGSSVFLSLAVPTKKLGGGLGTRLIEALMTGILVWHGLAVWGWLCVEVTYSVRMLYIKNRVSGRSNQWRSTIFHDLSACFCCWNRYKFRLEAFQMVIFHNFPVQIPNYTPPSTNLGGWGKQL